MKEILNLLLEGDDLRGDLELEFSNRELDNADVAPTSVAAATGMSCLC